MAWGGLRLLINKFVGPLLGGGLLYRNGAAAFCGFALPNLAVEFTLYSFASEDIYGDETIR